MSANNENNPTPPRLSPILQVAITANNLHKSDIARQREIKRSPKAPKDPNP